MKNILILIAATALARAACIAVSGPRIAAGDLGDAVPQFRSLDPATSLGFAPLPGTQRILTGRQLLGMLQPYGIGVNTGTALPDVCVQREAHPLSSAALREALLRALAIEDAEIELIDFSKQSLPPGLLEFRREDLNHPPEKSPLTAVIWRGKLVYDGQRSISVWAKVRVSVPGTRFVATENIAEDTILRADQVETRRGPQFPDLSPSLQALDSIVGKVARQSISAYQRFTPGMLGDAPDVRKGGKVHVRVREGLAWLSLDGIAQSAGVSGDTILVHNPLSGRNFRAVVTGKDEAMVRPSSGV